MISLGSGRVMSKRSCSPLWYVQMGHTVRKLTTGVTQKGPQTINLTDKDEKVSTIVVESRFIPVPVKLEPRESINSMSHPVLCYLPYLIVFRPGCGSC